MGKYLNIIEGMDTTAAPKPTPTVSAAPAVITRQRWGLPPSCEIPLATRPPSLAEFDHRLVMEHMNRQPPEAIRWALDRANEYATTRQWPARTCDVAGALDVILWQRQAASVEEVLVLLREIEEMSGGHREQN